MAAHQRAGRAATGWLGRIGSSLSLVFLSLSILAALVLVVIPLVTGSQTYTVLTSSMKPGYPPGTFLVMKPQPFDSLGTGDVITYQIESGKPAVVTHRIVSASATQSGDKTVITKGDNNSVEDEEPVIEAQVRGKLFYAVPYAGFAASAIGQGGKGLIVQVAAAALIGYGVLTIARGALSKKRNPSKDGLVVVSRHGRRRANA